MSSAADMAERHRANLAELAELGMSLARELHARIMAAKTEASAKDLTLTLHRISRCVRQTHALEAKLERDRRLAEREAASQAARETLDQVLRKRSQVRAVGSRLIWTEAEGQEEAETLLDNLEGYIREQEALDEAAFVAAPIDAFIARIREDLAAAASGAGDEASDEPIEVVIWKDSG